MTVDEALPLKCYDSATDGRTRFGPHTAFVDPTTPADAPPRGEHRTAHAGVSQGVKQRTRSPHERKRRTGAANAPDVALCAHPGYGCLIPRVRPDTLRSNPRS